MAVERTFLPFDAEVTNAALGFANVDSVMATKLGFAALPSKFPDLARFPLNRDRWVKMLLQPISKYRYVML